MREKQSISKFDRILSGIQLKLETERLYILAEGFLCVYNMQVQFVCVEWLTTIEKDDVFFINPIFFLCFISLLFFKFGVFSEIIWIKYIFKTLFYFNSLYVFVENIEYF